MRLLKHRVSIGWSWLTIRGGNQRGVFHAAFPQLSVCFSQARVEGVMLPGDSYARVTNRQTSLAVCGFTARLRNDTGVFARPRCLSFSCCPVCFKRSERGPHSQRVFHSTAAASDAAGPGLADLKLGLHQFHFFQSLLNIVDVHVSLGRQRQALAASTLSNEHVSPHGCRVILPRRQR